MSDRRCRLNLHRLFCASPFLLPSRFMQKQTILYIIIALLLGFISGFALANSLNRTEVSGIKLESSVSGPPANSAAQSEPVLSPEEIKAKIAEADQNATNFSFQKDLGLALYRYGAMKQDVELLAQAGRLLDRAGALNPRDFDVAVGLGNSQFDIGFYRKDAASFQSARETYVKALEIKPDDADVQTDLGISYYLQEPPSYDRAEVELKKVAIKNPRHERSLQFLVQVQIKQNRIPDARGTLEKLKTINPSNPAIKELGTQLAAAESGAKG